MRKRKKITGFLSAALIGQMLIPSGVVQALSSEGEQQLQTITIMHTNDIHGRLVADSSSLGVAKLKTFVDQVQPDFLFDAGDALQGLPLSNESKGMMMLEAMNAIGYDAMVVGNHEFDFGYDIAKQYVNTADFPVLSTNILDKLTQESAFEKTHMFEAYGIQIGVIGVSTPETAEKTHPDNVVDVVFEDPYITTQIAVDVLEQQGADIIIALSHLGLDPSSVDRSDLLAERVTGLDLIIDGHSHTTLYEPLIVNRTPIVQTGGYLNNVGLVEVTYDTKTNAVVDVQGHLEATKDNLVHIQQDEELQSLVAQAQADFDERTNVPVFENTVLLDGVREHVRTRETNLGNLITDAMADYGQTGGFKNRTDFAVTNGGGIRANLEIGTVTLGNIITVLPFGNQISQIPLTGAEIIAMYEKSVGEYPAANGGFLQSSRDIIVNYNVAANKGERILTISIADENGQYHLLDEEQTYYVAMPDFLSVGGDGYTMLAGKVREEGGTLDSVVANYTKLETFISETYAWSTGSERLLATNFTSDIPILTSPMTTIDVSGQMITFGEVKVTFDAEIIMKQTDTQIELYTYDMKKIVTLDLVNKSLTIQDAITSDTYVVAGGLFMFTPMVHNTRGGQAVQAYEIDLVTGNIHVDGVVIGQYTQPLSLSITQEGGVMFNHPDQTGLPEVGLGPDGDVTPELSATPESNISPTPDTNEQMNNNSASQTLPETGMVHSQQLLGIGIVMILSGSVIVYRRARKIA